MGEEYKQYNPLYPVIKPLNPKLQYIQGDDGSWIRLTNPGMEVSVTARRPNVESDELYTAKRIAETKPKRTWLSDAADISHAIGEAAMASNIYTSIPYFGSKLINRFINGEGASMGAAMDAAMLFPYYNALKYISSNAVNFSTQQLRNAAGNFIFVKKPNSFTRGIGGEQGLQDLLESGLVRGNPIGTEVSPVMFGKLYRHNRNNFKDIMDATKIDGIAQRYYNRSLTKEDFEAIKNAALKYVKQYETTSKPKSERFAIALGRQNPDPLSEYGTWEEYLSLLASDRASLRNATSFDDSGLPLAYFYDDGRNPIASGHDYAASEYGVRINNANEYGPRIFPGHLHYSMPNAVSLYDNNVELFRRGPFGLTIKMRKPTKK